MTVCSFCNTDGHNKRTCYLSESALCLVDKQAQVDQPIKIKRKYTCSLCNGVGHNTRACGLKYDRSLESGTMPGFTWGWWSAPAPSTLKIKKTRRCACCGDTGHNIRTCPDTGSIGTSIPRSIPREVQVHTRKPRIPGVVNRGVQVTQVVDLDIFDEPWVWAPIKPGRHVNRRLTLSTMDDVSPLVFP